MVQSLRCKTITFKIAAENKRCGDDRYSVREVIPSLQCRSIATDIMRFSSEECMRSLDSAVSRYSLQSRMRAKKRGLGSRKVARTTSISHRQEIVRATRLPFAMQSEPHL